MPKFFFFSFLFLFLGVSCSSPLSVAKEDFGVPIPDAHFRAALLADGRINLNHDAIISVDEAARFSDTLFLDGRQIVSLSGLQFFTHLSGLSCPNNQLKSIDLSYNSFLQTLYCNNNQLTELKVEACPLLQELSCGDNQLSVLNISHNLQLYRLECVRNRLQQLDASAMVLSPQFLLLCGLQTSDGFKGRFLHLSLRSSQQPLWNKTVAGTMLNIGVNVSFLQ